MMPPSSRLADSLPNMKPYLQHGRWGILKPYEHIFDWGMLQLHLITYYQQETAEKTPAAATVCSSVSFFAAIFR